MLGRYVSCVMGTSYNISGFITAGAEFHLLLSLRILGNLFHSPICCDSFILRHRGALLLCNPVYIYNNNNIKNNNYSVALVHERTLPTERLTLVDEVIANFSR
jgi:hypothetical protein